ncbi:MAG: hypothetical protein KAR13_03285, partial [Desulfobulbaceae bacterium]|nr:hypothetical protein [Desulfobulbaceae bacterium]
MMSRFMSRLNNIFSSILFSKFLIPLFSTLFFLLFTSAGQASQLNISWEYSETLSEPGGFRMYLGGNRIPECETFDVAARQLTCEVALQEGINN